MTTTPPSLVAQNVGNADNGEFPYGLAFDIGGTKFYFPAHVLLNTSFTPINPATDDTLQTCATALAEIQTATATLANNTGGSTMFQTIEALAVGQSYTHPANPTRKSIMWMVTGPGAIAVRPGIVAAPDAMSGMVYNGCIQPSQNAPTSGWQGSVQEYDGPSVPTNAFTFVALDQATNVVIWEGL